MLTFKIFKSAFGHKCVVNLASIDAIIHRTDDTALVQVGALEIIVTKVTAEHLEQALGATA